mmetsp:Transcript_40079/g.95746  ORF Transcript_40079/g.95746 Transcript_40079/m.95746 type:complete len:127 (-) Transcript_40079:169-549(-)
MDCSVLQARANLPSPVSELRLGRHSSGRRPYNPAGCSNGCILKRSRSMYVLWYRAVNLRICHIIAIGSFCRVVRTDVAVRPMLLRKNAELQRHVLDIPASAVTVSAAERMILRGGQGAVREKMWQW